MSTTMDGTGVLLMRDCGKTEGGGGRQVPKHKSLVIVWVCNRFLRVLYSSFTAIRVLRYEKMFVLH